MPYCLWRQSFLDLCRSFWEDLPNIRSKITTRASTKFRWIYNAGWVGHHIKNSGPFRQNLNVRVRRRTRHTPLHFAIFSTCPASLLHRNPQGCIVGANKTYSREARGHTRLVSGLLTPTGGHFPISTPISPKEKQRDYDSTTTPRRPCSASFFGVPMRLIGLCLRFSVIGVGLK